MKAFVRAQYGPPDVLKFEDVDSPVVKDDDVLVRVHASSLNQGDLDYLYGKPFLTRMGIGLRAPRHRGLGFDAAGQIEAVGKDITRFQPGDAVFGDLTQFGHSAFAEYAIAPERAWAQKPSSMSYEEAATLPQAAILALQGLRGRGGIAPGHSVLINGASGSVGPFAVQIAKAFGAHVTGVCSPKKMDMVRSLGADKVIDYTRDDYTRGRAAVRPDRRCRGQPFDLPVPARAEAQRRVRPARRLHESNLRLPVPRAIDHAGRAQENGIPVVETLPKRRRVVPQGAHRGWEDQAGDRQNLSAE